jgi:hypothetical protein
MNANFIPIEFVIVAGTFAYSRHRSRCRTATSGENGKTGTAGRAPRAGAVPATPERFRCPYQIPPAPTISARHTPAATSAARLERFPTWHATSSRTTSSIAPNRSPGRLATIRSNTPSSRAETPGRSLRSAGAASFRCASSVAAVDPRANALRPVSR